MNIKGRATLLVKDFIATRLGAAAGNLARRAIEIEQAHPYSGKEPSALEVREQLPHKFVMELAASTVVMSVACLEGVINELFTEVPKSLDRRFEPYGNLSAQALTRWREFWQRGIPGRGFDALAKGQLALALADLPTLPEDRAPAQDVKALLRLRNALVHAEASYQPHGRDLTQSERGLLERQLSGKFPLSTMVAETRPFLWQRVLSAGCARWAVETENAYVNALYSAMGIGAQGTIIWDRPCAYWSEYTGDRAPGGNS